MFSSPSLRQPCSRRPRFSSSASISGCMARVLPEVSQHPGHCGRNLPASTSAHDTPAATITCRPQSTQFRRLLGALTGIPRAGQTSLPSYLCSLCLPPTIPLRSSKSTLDRTQRSKKPARHPKVPGRLRWVEGHPTDRQQVLLAYRNGEVEHAGHARPGGDARLAGQAT